MASKRFEIYVDDDQIYIRHQKRVYHCVNEYDPTEYAIQICKYMVKFPEGRNIAYNLHKGPIPSTAQKTITIMLEEQQ